MKKSKKLKKSKRSRRSTTIIVILVFLIGLSLLAYPTVSDQWNKMHQTRVIVSHAQNVAKLSEEERESLISSADAFNRKLLHMPNRWEMSEEDRAAYRSLLISDDTEIMACIEIPKIKVSLPVYHGTGSSVLQQAIGHMEGSSLPVGGKGTHCVLSGHRGLPSAKLFTSLDKLSEGDTFMLYTVDLTLTYEVDQINIVLPTDFSTLEIDPEQDAVTLFTCTPYGINTHRLMVHAHRVDTVTENRILVTADAIQLDQIVVASCIGVTFLTVLFLAVLLMPRKKHRRRPE